MVGTDTGDGVIAETRGGPGASPGRQARHLSLTEEGSLKARLIARDESALVELIDRASPWLLGLAQSLLSDHHEAEEVVLDTFRICWEKVGTLGSAEDERFLPWLFRIARNRAIDRLRGRQRSRVRLARSALAAVDDAAIPAVEPDESALPGWHVHRQVHSALEGLPEEQRAAVRLVYFEGLTQSEIATRLGIPLGTVKTRLRLAFARLRKALAPLQEWLA